MLREAPAVMSRRDQWRDLEGAILRNVIADSFDQNDREHVNLAREVRKVNLLLTTNLAALSLASFLLAANLVFRVV